MHEDYLWLSVIELLWRKARGEVWYCFWKALLKADKEDLPDMIDELRGIKKKEDEKETRPIEESVANVSMVGNANMFITGMNNYLSRFPKLRLDPAYIPRTLSVIEAVRDYLNEVEKDLLVALQESSTNENTPQSEQET